MADSNEPGEETIPEVGEEDLEEVIVEPEEVEEVKNPKIRLVFSDESLANLAELLGPKLGLTVLMYMNVPTSRLVYMRTDCAADKECNERELMKRFFIYWRKMRETATERQKVKDLVRALTFFKKDDIADSVTEARAANEVIPGPPPPEEPAPDEDAMSGSILLDDVGEASEVASATSTAVSGAEGKE